MWLARCDEREKRRPFEAQGKQAAALQKQHSRRDAGATKWGDELKSALIASRRSGHGMPRPYEKTERMAT